MDLAHWQPAFIPTYKTVSAKQSPGCKLYPEVIMNGGVPGASITFEPGLWCVLLFSCPTVYLPTLALSVSSAQQYICDKSVFCKADDSGLMIEC